MTDCKHCKMTDEYCASGDCNKIQENDLACNEISLTEQWKKGELPEGEEYWIILTDEWYSRRPVAPVRAFYSCDHEFEGYYDNDIKEVLAPVPSYEEWKAAQEQLHKDGVWYTEISHKKVLKENAQLKELLKQIRGKIKTVYDMDYREFITSAVFDDAFVAKIDGVLK